MAPRKKRREPRDAPRRNKTRLAKSNDGGERNEARKKFLFVVRRPVSRDAKKRRKPRDAPRRNETRLATTKTLFKQSQFNRLKLVSLT